MKSSNRRIGRRVTPHGFTLIEVVVAIAIIGCLAVLILSAVQSARGAARRTRCASNLRQIGMAIYSYSSAMGCLPLAANGSRAYSIHSMILGNLEQIPLYNSTNFSVEFTDRQNKTVRRAVISTFLCPSDSNNGKGRNNYAGNTGYGFQVYNNTFNGVFTVGPISPVGLADISDGTSNTAMMSEWVVGPRTKTDSKPLGIVYYTSKRLLKPQQFDQFIAVCQSVSPVTARRISVEKGSSWIEGSLGHTIYNHNMQINQNSCFNYSSYREGSWTASSLHSSGCNVLFADGHTIYMTSAVSLPVWRAIGTRAGGETLNASQ